MQYLVGEPHLMLTIKITYTNNYKPARNCSSVTYTKVNCAFTGTFFLVISVVRCHYYQAKLALLEMFLYRYARYSEEKGGLVLFGAGFQLPAVQYLELCVTMHTLDIDSISWHHSLEETRVAVCKMYRSLLRLITYLSRNACK